MARVREPSMSSRETSEDVVHSEEWLYVAPRLDELVLEAGTVLVGLVVE